MDNQNLLAIFDTGKGQGITNPIYGDSWKSLLNSPFASPTVFFANLITKAVEMVFIAGIIFFFFMLIIGGVQWIASGGDKQAIESARGRLTNALIGMVILLGSYAILKLIGLIFGIDILTLDIGGLKI